MIASFVLALVILMPNVIVTGTEVVPPPTEERLLLCMEELTQCIEEGPVSGPICLCKEDGSVTIGEVIGAINFALTGCPK